MVEKKFQIFIAVMIIAMSGCLVPKEVKKQAEDKIKEAEEHFKTVESLSVEKTYPDDFVTAKKELDLAKKYFAKKWETKKAIPSAEKSLSASKIILKQYYLDGIAEMAKKLKKNINEKVGKDKDSPLNDYLSELDDILDYAEELEKGKQIASLDKVLTSLDKCLKIQDITISFTSADLESDVSFDIGTYELSDRGMLALEENFLKKIVADKNDYKKRYPDSVITIKIKVVGYTDMVGFNEKKPLFKEITQNLEDSELPPKDAPEERRGFLNQRLSELRARAISQYIEERILATENETSQVKVEREAIGRGEEIAPGVTPSGQIADPNRRICKIYSTISYIAR